MRIIRLTPTSLLAAVLFVCSFTLFQHHRLTERLLQTQIIKGQQYNGPSHHGVKANGKSGIAGQLPSSLVYLTDAKRSNATILVHLSGEMGNNLHKLAFARGLQLMAKEAYDLDLNLALRHQDHSKWQSAKRNLQQCFPNTRQLNFKAGNTQEYFDRQIEQKLWLGPRTDTLTVKGNSIVDMTTVLENLQSVLLSISPPKLEAMNRQVENIRLPYISSNEMVDWHTLDTYRKELWEWLRFDHAACCPTSDILPSADESVFHFRNFLTELKNGTTSLGFDELSAHATATYLFGKLSEGDKVAITTRFDNSVTQEYVQSLRTERQADVRVLSGHSATEDFCFLTQAKKELVGGQRSSFFVWAAYLGLMENRLQSIRSYAVLSNSDNSYNYSDPNIIGAPRRALSAGYDWKDPILKARWKFETYATSNL